MSWWRSKKWISVFFIVPKLSEEQPLWKRDETSLGSLRLFNLRPAVLQAQIHAYWQRPFWQRWCLDLFTEINNKRKVWSYYQRCLAFDKIQKQPTDPVSVLSGSMQERAIGAELVIWLDRETKRCEQRLEKHAGDLNWLSYRYPSLLRQYEQKRERAFLKLMDKKLKKISSKEGRKNLRRRIRKEYQALGNVMRDYLSYPSSLEQSSAHKDGATASTSVGYEATESGIVSDSQALVYVGPAIDASNTLRMYYPTGDTELGHIDAVVAWVKLKRQAIENLLEEGRPEAYREIQALLEQSLHNIKDLITPQIDRYREMVSQLSQGNASYETSKAAIKCLENLQRRLMSFFRNSALLFHPDKSHGNEDLSQIQTKFFRQFRQLSETSQETLSADLERLKDCVPQCEAEIQAILDEIERDRKAFRAELAHMIKALAQMREERKEMRAELEAKRAQDLAEMEAKREQERTEMRAELEAEMRAEMEKLRQLVLTQSLVTITSPAEAASSQVQEKPEGSSHFFRP